MLVTIPFLLCAMIHIVIGICAFWMIHCFQSLLLLFDAFVKSIRSVLLYHETAEYKVTVVCDSPSCTVMVFTQDDVAFKMDEELSGSILRMSYKSHAQLQRSFVSDERLVRRSSVRRSSVMRVGSRDTNIMINSS